MNDLGCSGSPGSAPFVLVDNYSNGTPNLRDVWIANSWSYYPKNLALRFFSWRINTWNHGAVLEIHLTSLMVFFRIEKQDLSSMWTTYLPVLMKLVLRTPKRYLFYQGDSGAGCGVLPGWKCWSLVACLNPGNLQPSFLGGITHVYLQMYIYTGLQTFIFHGFGVQRKSICLSAKARLSKTFHIAGRPFQPFGMDLSLKKTKDQNMSTFT